MWHWYVIVAIGGCLVGILGMCLGMCLMIVSRRPTKGNTYDPAKDYSQNDTEGWEDEG